ncbi:hypothetical protein MN608_08668 [Microdochium nivale]|nr:hypothetical protein MN608_08668 [Microdochium nivale]
MTTEFYRADKALAFQLGQLKQGIENVVAATVTHRSCSEENVLDALSSVLMFGKSSKASIAGSTLSIATDFYSSMDEAVNTIGGVEKELLYGKPDYMTQMNQDDGSLKEMGSTLEDIRKNHRGRRVPSANRGQQGRL